MYIISCKDNHKNKNWQAFEEIFFNFHNNNKNIFYENVYVLPIRPIFPDRKNEIKPTGSFDNHFWTLFAFSEQEYFLLIWEINIFGEWQKMKWSRKRIWGNWWYFDFELEWNEYSFWMDGRTKTIIDRTNWQSNCQDKLQKGHYRWRYWNICINMQRIFRRNKRSEVLTKKEWKGGDFGTFLRRCFGLLWTWSAGWFAKINIIWRRQMWWLQVDVEEDQRRGCW